MAQSLQKGKNRCPDIGWLGSVPLVDLVFAVMRNVALEAHRVIAFLL
jgi:hypothetical protein